MPNEKTNNEFKSGARIDTRTEEKKEKDYIFREIVSAVAPVKWVEKPQSEWRKFPIFNQDGSGSCVAQTMAKLMGIMYWLKNQVYVHFSATHIYQRRNNKPLSGMSGIDVFKIAQKGVTLEELVPSQSLSDLKMDSTVIEKYKEDVGEIFKIGNYIIITEKDMDTIASVIQTTGKAVMTWFFFQRDEWDNVPIIKNLQLDLYSKIALLHSVTAVDFTLYQGKKALIIEDSWGAWGNFTGQRIITEDFFKSRNFFAAYPMNFTFEESKKDRPKYNFVTNLSLGDTSSYVTDLQNVLKYEGIFPLNIESTGYFGAITKKAVQDFQVKYSIVGKDAPDTGVVGPRTRAKLNELYN